MTTNMTDKRYADRVLLLRQQIREWVKANPADPPKIQFNYPNHVEVIGEMTEAVNKTHFVSANDAGLKLITALEDGTGLSIIMWRIALDTL